jgi:cytochrome P450
VEDTGVLCTDLLEADEQNHAKQRRICSHAFSTKTLKGQEKLIMDFIDFFVHKGREKTENRKRSIDINAWYNYVPFDITGELAFGESFECMATSKCHDPKKINS